VALTLAGMVFAALYLSTRNLWFTVGIHALVNEPVMLAGGVEAGGALAAGAGLLLAAAWLAARTYHGGVPAGPESTR
jgi:uncharacterized protein